MSTPPADPSRFRIRGFPDMGRFWTAANMLSLLRAVLVAPITWLVWHGGPVGPMAALIALAVGTDFLDGSVARWSRTVSEWGKALDATADKLAAACVCAALLLRPETSGPRLDLWFVVLVIVRDAMLAVGGLLQTQKLGRFTTSLWSGKVAVTLLAVTVCVVLLNQTPRVVEAATWATAAVMVVSMVEYVRRFRLIWRLGPALTLDANGNVVKGSGAEGPRSGNPGIGGSGDRNTSEGSAGS